mgnify:CR=1 FL=1
MIYLGWRDDNPKTTPARRIADACAAYRARCQAEPTIALVNEAQVCDVPGLVVRPAGNIRPNIVWVGREP